MTSLFRDPVGETYMTFFGNMGLSHLVKYSTTGVKRFDMIVPTPGQNQAQAATIEPVSGDIIFSSYSWGLSQTGMAISCYSQAPVALVDGFICKPNVQYLSPRPVTRNDRQAGGAAISVVEQPQHGTVLMLGNGQFRYTPTNWFTGIDTFKYRLSKSGLDTSTAQVTIQVKS